MDKVKEKIAMLFRDPMLRGRLYVTLWILFFFRLFAFIPVSVVDTNALKTYLDGNQFFSLLNVYSGGTLLNFSVMALGLNPYINASIIIQLLTMVVPSLEALTKEGEYGRRKMNQYTRFLTIPLTLVQSIGIYALLKSQNIVGNLNTLELIYFVTTLVAGTFILMWFGELISEFGLGNGISMIIFAGIVGRLHIVVLDMFKSGASGDFTSTLIMLLISFAVVWLVVFVNESVRKIPVHYAKRIKGNRVYQGATNYLPIKLNQAGIIPIIFAISFVFFPQLIGNFLRNSSNTIVASIAGGMADLFQPSGLVYNVLYFFLVVGFTYFYTMIIFNPHKVSEEIQKHGGFIQGIRPGTATKDYLQTILYRITTAGAFFLGLIAIMPAIISLLTGYHNLIIGGASVLIVVSVVLETFKNVEAQLVMRSYDKFVL